MEIIKKYNFSVALILSAIILGIFFYKSRQQNNSVKVVGYATHTFQSDIIRWSFNISETVNFQNLKNGYNNLNSKLKKLREIIESRKLDSLDITVKPIRINDIYDRNGITSDKKLSQDLIISSRSIDKIEYLSTNPTIFIENNLLFEYSNISYYYSKLNLIKKELLGKAVINSRERAEEILNALGNKVGDLKSAKSGVFQITEPFSTDVAGYGLHSTSTRKKNIKVTVSAQYEIL